MITVLKLAPIVYKFFSRIINIYNPISVMCNFLTAITKKFFLEWRMDTSIYLHPIWDFSYTFLFPKVPSLKLLRQVFW